MDPTTPIFGRTSEMCYIRFHGCVYAFCDSFIVIRLVFTMDDVLSIEQRNFAHDFGRGFANYRCAQKQIVEFCVFGYRDDSGVLGQASS